MTVKYKFLYCKVFSNLFRFLYNSSVLKKLERGQEYMYCYTYIFIYKWINKTKIKTNLLNQFNKPIVFLQEVLSVLAFW